VARPRGATWNSAGVILFGQEGGSLFQVQDSGGEPPVPVSELMEGEYSHVVPQFLSTEIILFIWPSDRY